MHIRFALVVALAAVMNQVALAETTTDSDRVGPDPAKLRQTVSKALNYLETTGQADDGSYTSVAGPGVTALITTGVLRSGRSLHDPLVAKSLKYVLGHVQKDGGIYKTGSLYRNYETSLAIMCLSEANLDGRYDEVVQNAVNFIKGIQTGAPEDSDESDPAHGGAGYGKHKRPDLSNTGYLMEAIIAAGGSKDDPAMQKALMFVLRCQNRESEHNTTKHSPKVNDNGFYYTAAAGGSSQAGKTPNGGLRSYGSMTYVGLKSMIYAGVDKNDPRVAGAFEWIQKNYDLQTNPGLGLQGLFYYYQTFAKALDAMGEDLVADADGSMHDWRAELAATMADHQKEDGSFMNKSERWMENDPNLVTGYALLALSYCKPNDAK